MKDPTRTNDPTSSSMPIQPSTPRMKALAAGRTFAGTQRSLLKSMKGGSSKWDVLTDVNSSVRILAQGHVHAKQEMTEVDRWREKISESFINPNTPAIVPKLKLEYPGPVEPICRSPDHFERRYGVKRTGFSPRTSPRSVGRHHRLASGRAAQNLEARAECWKRARVQPSDPSNTTALFDAAGRPPTPRRLWQALVPSEEGAVGSPVVG
jgi:hypothetical protein